MYRISVYDYFSSAHRLRGYNGKCENLHGHNWKVEINLEGSELDSVGMLMDFTQAKALLRDIIEEMDHAVLNDLEPFTKINPSSELIAKYIYGRVKAALPAGITIHSATVWESEKSRAKYYE